MERNFSKDGGSRAKKNNEEMLGRLKYQKFKNKESEKPADNSNVKPDDNSNAKQAVNTKSP